MTARRSSPEDHAVRKDKGVRRAGGVASRILAFFVANPDEELTEIQAEAKFEASAAMVKLAVRELSRDRVLERVTVVRLPSKGRMS